MVGQQKKDKTMTYSPTYKNNLKPTYEDYVAYGQAIVCFGLAFAVVVGLPVAMVVWG